MRVSTNPLRWPASSTSGVRAVTWKSSHCISVMTAPRGMNSSPMPRKSRGCLRKRRHDAVVSSPHARARASGAGRPGRQVVRERPHTSSTASAASTTVVGPGLVFIRFSSRPPAAT